MTDINEFLLNKIDKFDEKLDRQSEETRDAVKEVSHELTYQSKLLADYNQSLREHIKRTRMLEEKVEPLHAERQERLVADKLKMKTWKKVTVILGVLATLVGIGVGIAQLLGLI